MRLVLAALLLATTAAPALAATGEELFNGNCADCHALAPTAGQTAPPLQGVVGRKIAYSDALTAKSADTWTPANLDAFLANPQAFAPGTAMYGGAADPADRKALIDYLASQK
jgi:cytochrome c